MDPAGCATGKADANRREGLVLRSSEGVAASHRRRNEAVARGVIMSNDPADKSAQQSEGTAVVSSGRAHALEDGPVDRPSGAIEDGIVSSTADPAEGREFGGGKTEPPGDAEPVLPPYDGRKESTAGGTPRRGEDEVTKNTNVTNSQDTSTKIGFESGDGDQGTATPAHTPGTGRGEDKL
jgi:hypothetical protein